MEQGSTLDVVLECDSKSVTTEPVVHGVTAQPGPSLPSSSLLRGYYGLSRNNIVASLNFDRTNCVGRPQRRRETYMNEYLASCDSMYSTNIRGHHGCVNALGFSRGGDQYLATGGDDQRVLVWRVVDAIQGKEELTPISMVTRHRSNIFTLDFSCDNSYIFSGGDDAELIKHDFKTQHFVNSYEHLEAVYSVSTHPSSPEVVFTASEDGCVYIIDTRLSRRELGHDMLLCEDLDSYQCVAINPVEPRLVAVSNARNGTSLYDTRNRKEVIAYKSSHGPSLREDAVSVCFNSTGTQLFSMYRRRAPTLHDLWESTALCHCSDITGAYRNSVTMKSGCFLGQNDEFVVSGSDDFRLYIWKVPTKTKDSKELSIPIQQNVPHLVLPGHRSIVNQTRYSKTHHVLVTSGVEKLIKIWSDMRLNQNQTLHKSKDPPSRRRYTSLELRIMMTTSSPLEPSDPTEEDQKVLALFDNLVQEDMEGDDNFLSSSESSISSDYFPVLDELPFFDLDDSSHSDMFGPVNAYFEPSWSEDTDDDDEDEWHTDSGERNDDDDDDDWDSRQEDADDEDEDGHETERRTDEVNGGNDGGEMSSSEGENQENKAINSGSICADVKENGLNAEERGHEEQSGNELRSSENSKEGINRVATFGDFGGCGDRKRQTATMNERHSHCADVGLNSEIKEEGNSGDNPDGIRRLCPWTSSEDVCSSATHGGELEVAAAAGCSKPKTKRQRLIHLQTRDFSQYNLGNFLKTEPSGSLNNDSS